MSKADRGFASMAPTRRQELASKGGKSVHAKKTAYRFSPEKAKEAQRKSVESKHAKKIVPTQ